jgi:hypothetical protein
MSSARGSGNLPADDDTARENRARSTKRQHDAPPGAEGSGPSLVRPERRSRLLKKATPDRPADAADAKPAEVPPPAAPVAAPIETPAASADKPEDPPPPSGPKVVKLDAFRKK